VRLGWSDQQGAAVPSDTGDTVEVGTVTLP
jgi:hypothetical protein